MQIEKWIATILSALMAATVFTGAALAADLKEYPGNLAVKTATTSALDAYIVIGKKAAAEDVAGAADIAARLAELQYDIKAVPGVAAETITGVDKDTIGINAQLDSVLPNPVKNIHYTGFKKSTFRWKSNDYDYSEQLDLGTAKMSHDFGTDKLNGTQKLVVTSGEIVYEYVFEETLTGTGSTTTKNYTYPVEITLAGKKFIIVGAGSNSIIALTGVSGTVIKEGTSYTNIKFGKYEVRVKSGANNDWATFEILDETGAVVDTVSGITEGNSKDSTVAGLTIQVTDVRVSGTDPATQHIEADIVVGDVGAVEKTYTTTCDITGTGTADKKFPGETKWCIQVSGFATAGRLSNGDKIQVVFKPGETTYYKAGETLVLPNKIGEIGFVGWNTAKFVTLTAKPTEISAYNYSNMEQSLGTMKGIEVSADIAGTLINPFTRTGYNKVYLLFNTSLNSTHTAVMTGWWDDPNSKVVVNTSSGTGIGTSSDPYYRHLNLSIGTNTFQTYSFTWNVSYGGASSVADQQLLMWNVSGVNTSAIINFMIGTGSTLTPSARSVTMDFRNKTTLASTTSVPDFRLGSSDSAEEADVVVDTTAPGGSASAYNIGKATQDVVSDGGVIVVSPGSYSGSQIVKVQVPAESLKVRAYVGKKEAVTAAEQTYNALSPIKTAVAKLDSEAAAGSAVRTKNLVLVGGPCANSLVQELVDAGKLNSTYTCAGGKMGSAWVSGTSYILLVDGYFAAGKVAIVVAGTDAADTRLATSVMQQYDSANVKEKLTGTAVKITGTAVETATIATA